MDCPESYTWGMQRDGCMMTKIARKWDCAQEAKSCSKNSWLPFLWEEGRNGTVDLFDVEGGIFMLSIHLSGKSLVN